MKLPRKKDFVMTFIPSISILALIAAAGTLREVTAAQLTRDVTALAAIHPLSGVLSSLGILLWGAAVSVCLFVALTIRSTAPTFYFCWPPPPFRAGFCLTTCF